MMQGLDVAAMIRDCMIVTVKLGGPPLIRSVVTMSRRPRGSE